MLYSWLGAGLIVAATTYIGFKNAEKLSRRVRSLLAIQTGLSILESEISFSANHLKQALSKIEESVHTCGLFQDAGAAIAELGTAEAWRQTVQKKQDVLCLSKSDVEALSSLAAELGVTDRENQMKNIRRVSALLEDAGKTAQAEYEKTARLYQSGGVLIGVLVVILLL